MNLFLKMAGVILLLAGIAGKLSFQKCDGGDPVAQTAYGKVCGVLEEGGIPGLKKTPVAVFKGVRYGADTGKENRWLAPRRPEPWSGVKPAKVFQEKCIQWDYRKSEPESNVVGSEDCLFLNVYTPVIKPSLNRKKLPVLVFIHGGAFLNGSSSDYYYYGNNLAGGGDIVVVTLNYRLDVFGFLGNFGDAVNNAGLLDQRMALQWVMENIENFGGDPKQVTLMGQSAGASSVGAHLVSPESKKMFQRAVMISNHYGMLYQDMANAKYRANKMAGLSELLPGVGCYKGTEKERIDCLRHVKAETLLEYGNALPEGVLLKTEAMQCNSWGGFEYWAPVVDGEFIPLGGKPVASILDKPVLMGTVKDEGGLFASILPAAILDKLLYIPTITTMYEKNFSLNGELSDYQKVLEQYPLPEEPQESTRRLAQIITDDIFFCAGRHVLKNSLSPKTYAYYFDHPVSNSVYPIVDYPGTGRLNDACNPLVEGNSEKVCHAEDLPYYFGNPAKENGFFKKEELLFLQRVMGYVVNFVRKGNPNGKGLPHWPPFRKGGYARLGANLDDPDAKNARSIVNYPAHARCDALWEEVGWKPLESIREFCPGK